MKKHSLLALLFSLLIFTQTVAAESALVFEGAWIAEAPPVSKVLAAYMAIKNPSNQVINIVSVTSENFKSISFHQTQQKNGMASMQHMDTLTIPAKGELTLEAGSYHMMLFSPIKKLTAGDQVNFDFKLDNGDTIKLTVPVKKQNADQPSHDLSKHQHH